MTNTIANPEHQKLIRALRGVQHIVINTTHGGFGLSKEGVLRYHEIKNQPCWVESTSFSFLIRVWTVPPEQRLEIKEGIEWYAMSDDEKKDYNDKYDAQTWDTRDLARDDSTLVQVVRELGDRANGAHAKLKIVSIPADVKWQIQEYDGKEWVAEVHRTWE